MPFFTYILYSEKLDRFYAGSCEDVASSFFPVSPRFFFPGKPIGSIKNFILAPIETTALSS